MRFWGRRRETLNEKLLREGGIEPAAADQPAVPGRFGFFGEVAVTGLQRLREWDATATAEAPELTGDEVVFVVLSEDSVLADERIDYAAFAPLAEAVEEQLEPPYRARGVRRHGDVWAVAANAIEVVDLQPDVDGLELELVSRAGERTLTVDGARSFGSVPRLERLAESRHADYVVHASRLDGSLWEIRVDPL